MKKLIFLSTLIFAFSCSTMNTAVDYDRSQDFSEIKNYRYEITTNNLSEWTIASLQRAINTNMRAKGAVFNENSKVIMQISPAEHITQETNSHVSFGAGTGGRNFGTSMGVGIPITSQKLNQQYKVSLYNAEGNLIWDSVLNLKMPANASHEAVEANIKRGVDKLFKKYPAVNRQ